MRYSRSVSSIGLLMLVLSAGEGLAQQDSGTHLKTEGDNSPLVTGITNGNVNVTYKIIQKEAADARGQLARRGVPWSADFFGKALLEGDELAVKLFLKGGMDVYAEYQGTYAVAKFVSDTKHLKKFDQVFGQLLRHRLDVDHPLEERLSPGKPTLAEHAVAGEHLRAFQRIWSKSRKKDAQRIRQAIQSKLSERQEERPVEGTSGARARKAAANALAGMLLTVEPGHRFALEGHRVYEGEAGWVLWLKTNSFVEEITYTVHARRRTVRDTVQLPINVPEDFKQPRTPVHIRARDVLGRTLEVTLVIDREEIP